MNIKIYSAAFFSMLLMSTAYNKKEEATPNDVTEKEVTNEVVPIELTAEQSKHVNITIGQTTKMVVSKVIDVNGITTVKPENESQISSLIDGKLIGSQLVEGMQVKKGQLLGSIENTTLIDLQEQYLLAKAKYELVKADFRRQSELNKTQSASDKVVQQAKYNMSEQGILLNTLGSKLSMLGINSSLVSSSNLKRSVPIVAPFSGIVSGVLLSNGSFVTSNTPMFKIIDASKLYLVLKVYQEDIPFVKVGQTLKAKPNGEKEFVNAKIEFVNSALSTEGFGEVTCSLTATKDLTPGMYLTAQINLDSKEVNGLPEEAVVTFENKQYVYIQQGDLKYIPVEIKTGGSSNGFVEILDVTPLLGKNIVLTDAYALLMKSKNVEDE